MFLLFTFLAPFPDYKPMEALGLPKMILSHEMVFQQFNLAPEARTLKMF